MVNSGDPVALTLDRTQDSAAPFHRWHTIVWDDQINLMSYVVQVFQHHFSYSSEAATALMLEVHHRGKATVSHGVKERMEADVNAMHLYGLRATIEKEAS